MTARDLRDDLTFAIAPEKLTGYLLAMNSRDGRGKAKYFLAQGFAADSLETALLAHGASGSLRRIKQTEWGIVFEVTGPMDLPKGGTARILSAWQIDDGMPGVARLLTAHLD